MGKKEGFLITTVTISLLGAMTFKDLIAMQDRLTKRAWRIFEEKEPADFDEQRNLADHYKAVCEEIQSRESSFSGPCNSETGALSSATELGVTPDGNGGDDSATFELHPEHIAFGIAGMLVVSGLLLILFRLNSSGNGSLQTV